MREFGLTPRTVKRWWSRYGKSLRIAELTKKL
ncbi:MAG: helix-turn-helix domain-containing protein [Phascolarctobacterium sp.]|nr:helix-turn-helix domain-containing protein [Phascolarctobacterium sp.]